MNEETMMMVEEEVIPTKKGLGKGAKFAIGAACAFLAYKGVKMLKKKFAKPEEPSKEDTEEGVIDAKIVKDVEKKMNS